MTVTCHSRCFRRFDHGSSKIIYLGTVKSVGWRVFRVAFATCSLRARGCRGFSVTQTRARAWEAFDPVANRPHGVLPPG